MTPQERRAAIVAAALPLLIERGAAVTSGQIAAAAGIAEGTVFRAFADKPELLAACMHTACDPAAAVRVIRLIPAQLPIRDRLLRTTAVVVQHWDRVMAVGQAVRTACSGPPLKPGPPSDVVEAMRALTSALSDLLAPDAAGLRLSPVRTAQLFLFAVTGDRMRMAALGAGVPADTEELIDVFLYGALEDR
jgi:AcrR family transcriptional regulator